MKKLSVALVGAGAMGAMHAENIINHVPNMKLHAIVEKDLSQNLHHHFDIPVYTNSYEDILEDDAVDAVIICTPSITHLDMIETAITHRKHIFCEKPIAFKPYQIAALNHKLLRNKLALQVGYNRRFDPEFMRLKQQISLGAIGDAHIIRITNRDPKDYNALTHMATGGLFMDINVHDFDLARFLVSSEIKSVYATGEVSMNPTLRSLTELDTAVITLQMEGGALCVIDSSCEKTTTFDQKIEVFGSHGTLEIKHQHTRPCTFQKETLAPSVVAYANRYHTAYIAQFESFASDVLSKKKPEVGSEDAMHAVAAAVAAQWSYNEHRIVMLDEVYDDDYCNTAQILEAV